MLRILFNKGLYIFSCGWCQSSKRCEVKDKCGRDASSWLKRDQTCPNPQITTFHPMSGPWEGGTNITINGINLGKNYVDIYGGVTVAGIPCQPYKELYKRTEQIVCKVDGPGMNKEKSGPILVKISDFRGESSTHYKFVDPKITGILPKRGPQSGGTRVEIKGEHMNAGSHTMATIGNSPCKIMEKYNDKVVCITGPCKGQDNRPCNGNNVKVEVKMLFDKGHRSLRRGKYRYVDDPKIDYVHTGINGGVNKAAKSILSGGINITVVGANFKDIQQPKMYVEYEKERYYSRESCEVIDDKRMFCLSPKIKHPVKWSNLDNPHPKKLNYGFIMDNVKRVQNLEQVLQGSQSAVLLYPDPEFEPFDGNGIKLYKTDYLVINGKNLNRAASEADMKVKIGTEICNVTSLSANQLTCKPPAEQPPISEINGEKNYDGMPDVIVMIGESSKLYKIGKLSYKLGEGKLPQPVLIGVIAGACFLLVMVFIFLILYRKKSSESTRVLKGKNSNICFCHHII